MTTAAQPNPDQRTLTIDIGGTGIKMMVIDMQGEAASERQRVRTPKYPKPAAVMEVIGNMIESQAHFDRVSVGFPGVIKRGVVKTAPNLGTADWAGFDLRAAVASCTKRPVRAMNDAELQGYGVIDGKGVEMVLTLGTGLGTGLCVDGHVMPNLELAHHPLKDGKTYEQLASGKELKRVGKKKWRKDVDLIVSTLEPYFQLRHAASGRRDKALAGRTLRVRAWRGRQRDTDAKGRFI